MMGDREGKENLFKVKMADMAREMQDRKMVRNSSRMFIEQVEYSFSLKNKCNVQILKKIVAKLNFFQCFVLLVVSLSVCCSTACTQG